MKIQIFLFSLLLIMGCSQQDQSRHYTEIVSQAPSSQTMPVAEQKPPENPHAGIDLGHVTPDAQAQLQKMLADGQDPHAGIDMSQFTGKNPHAGLDMAGMTADSADTSSPYAWDMPKGFKQGPNKAMRLASFYLENNPDAVDCYIVALPGLAGGSEANLKRWMGQIGIDVSDDNYQTLLKNAQSIQTQGGFEAKFYDFMTLQQKPSDKTMIAAIISTNDTTIFVKMTGSSEQINGHRDDFLALLKSLRTK